MMTTLTGAIFMREIAFRPQSPVDKPSQRDFCPNHAPLRVGAGLFLESFQSYCDGNEGGASPRYLQAVTMISTRMLGLASSA